MKHITDLFSSKAFCALLLWVFVPNLQANTTSETLKAMVNHSQALEKAPLLSREQVLRSSRLSQVTLSPNGKLVLYATRVGPRERNLTQYWLFNIASQRHDKLFASRDVASISWSANSQKLFMKVSDGLAVHHLQPDTAPIQLVTLDPQKRERWLGIDEFHKDSFYYRSWDVLNEQFEIKRMNAEGKATLIYSTTTDYADFVVDHRTGSPLLASTLNIAPNNKGELLFFDLTRKAPKEIWRCQWNEDCTVLDYHLKTQTMLLASNQFSDLVQLYHVDLVSGDHRVLHQDPLSIADITQVSLLQDGENIKAPALTNYHGDQNKAYAITTTLDPHLQSIQTALGQHGLQFGLPQDKQYITDNHWLVSQHTSDSAHTRYYLYQPQQQKLTPIFDDIVSKLHQKEPLMPDNAIAPKFAVRYQSRDGFELQGYLTLPRGIDPKKAPMVVSVHGGPWSRIFDGFDRRAQHLANRGYIVFQPNFRASDGFGKAYLTGTNNDFGDGTSQNDIIDGVHFLLNNSIGDKTRLAIIGHSFGGFSTLAGLTFTPDLFQVGFAGAPPTTMGRSAKYYFRFKEKIRKTHNDYFMKQLVVDWDDKTAFEALHARSPDKNYPQIKHPLVIWAGQHDQRVFITDVQDFALRLQEQNKPVTLFVDSKAQHSPGSRLGTLAYTYLQEKTLAKFLGGKLEPLNNKHDKALIRFIDKNLKLDANQLID
ncbi:alpha/beta hydrolase family protein [Thalassotalea fusca]